MNKWFKDNNTKNYEAFVTEYLNYVIAKRGYANTRENIDFEHKKFTKCFERATEEHLRQHKKNPAIPVLLFPILLRAVERYEESRRLREIRQEITDALTVAMGRPPTKEELDQHHTSLAAQMDRQMMEQVHKIESGNIQTLKEKP